MSDPRSSSPTGYSTKLWLFLGALGLASILAVVWLGRQNPDVEPRDGQANADTSTKPSGSARSGGSAQGTSLEPRWSTASGQVRAASGEALADALVTLAPRDEDSGSGAEPLTARTDAGGSWSLDQIPAGRYDLSATAPGYLAGVRPDLVLRDKSDNSGLDLELERGGASLSGLVSDKTGGVIEGALVQVTPSKGIVSMREHESYFTSTDAEGRYTVQVPAGRQRVRASHSDYSSESVVLEVSGETLTQDFALVPTALIEGVVVRESDGSPVAFAEVTWSTRRSIVLPDGGRIETVDRGGKVMASAEGRFRISGLAPGTIGLEARASQLASFAEVEIPLGIAERVADVELRLASASDVEGRVVASADGEGIAGARVQLETEMGMGLSATADEDGHFRLLGVLPGSYRALASAEGFDQPEGQPTLVEVRDEAPASVQIELPRALTIRGRVVPALRAEVSVELDPGSVRMAGGMMTLAMAAPSFASAETGEFELGPIKPGRYTLQARAADGRGGSVEVEVGDEGLDEVVISLEQRATLAGHVEDLNGKRIDDVSVRARKKRPASSVSVVVNGRELTALSSPTTTEGAFEIAGLEAGPWFVEVVDAQGNPIRLDIGSRLDLELSKGETRELVIRIEPRDGRIAGIVRDAEGEPVADAWVSAAYVAKPLDEPKPEPEAEGEVEHQSEMRMIVADGSGSQASLPPVLTDTDGRFVFEALRRGEYNLSAELDGGASKASLDGVQPDAEVTLELAPLGALEGQVSADGKSIDCVARISGPSQRSVRVRGGSFEVERLEPGRYTVEARTPEGATSETVEIEAGETAEVTLQLTRFASITGRVLDESGAPMAGVELMVGSGDEGRVEISREDGDPQYFTDEEGKFEIKAAAGARVLIAQAPGVPMPIVIKPFVVEGDQGLDLGDLRKQDMKGMMMMGGDEEGEPAAPESPAED